MEVTSSTSTAQSSTNLEISFRDCAGIIHCSRNQNDAKANEKESTCSLVKLKNPSTKLTFKQGYILDNA